MAAPNIVNVTTITGKTTLANVTTVLANVIAVSTNTVDKINDILLTNYSGTTVTANVSILRSGVNYPIAGAINVPGNSLLTLIGKDTALYLEEGDALQANCSVNVAISLTTSYEIIS
jgi:hypothetical protein